MKFSRSMTAVAAAAMLVAGSAASAAAATDAGVRDTDAPRTLHIGAPEQVVPLTVISGVPADAYEAVVAGPGINDGYGYGYVEGAEPGRPNVFKVSVEVVAEDIPSWGASTWYLRGYSADSGPFFGGEMESYTDRPVDVRANSLLGMSLKRYGDRVAVTASARAFHNVEGRYVPYSEKDIAVQAFTGEYWKQITGLTTDARGNQTTFPLVPRNTPLRLVLADTPTVWGAVSARQTI